MCSSTAVAASTARRRGAGTATRTNTRGPAKPGAAEKQPRISLERGDFPPVERDEFRVVVCLPMEANAFAHKAATDVWDDPSLDTVADFIVFTRGGHGGGVSSGVCAA